MQGSFVFLHKSICTFNFRNQLQLINPSYINPIAHFCNTGLGTINLRTSPKWIGISLLNGVLYWLGIVQWANMPHSIGVYLQNTSGFFRFVGFSVYYKMLASSQWQLEMCIIQGTTHCALKIEIKSQCTQITSMITQSLGLKWNFKYTCTNTFLIFKI